MSEIKVDTVAEKTSANGVTIDGLNIKDSKLVTANSVVETNLTNDIVTLAKMAAGTDGNIISYDASGNPVAIATGNDGQVLTSTGAGSPPAFETLAGVSLSGSTNNTVATVTGANALTGEANLTFNAANGNLTLGNGNITFGTADRGIFLGSTSATQSNCLKDYEEGTWTPAFSFGDGTTGIQYGSTRAGIYTKIGKLVTASFNVYITSKGSSTGNAEINLPFTPAQFQAGHNHAQWGMSSRLQNLAAAAVGLAFRVRGDNTAKAYLQFMRSGTSPLNGYGQNTDFANNTNMSATLIYQAAE